jgi:hypothetical protein
MINSITFQILFIYKGKEVQYTVDKMFISDREIEVFYRITAKTRNRDVLKVDDVWKVLSGAPIPGEVLQLVGDAIDVAEAGGLQNINEKKGLF